LTKEKKGKKRVTPEMLARSIRRDVESMMEELRQHLDEAIEPLFREPGAVSVANEPKVDICDAEDRYELEVEVPGFRKDEIQIEAEEDQLTLDAKREEEAEESERDYVRRERRSGPLHKVVSFPEPVLPDEVKAKMESGLLKITAPKKEPKPRKGRKVEIQ
jgi:HSP20 family molecular chaperone IbpA